ncbi:hypothetical protein C9I87_02910 [Photobacterium iliopiscarium]|nr:hypothetical protein C9I87_02910 [Photobacterium iliopiscarium]
MLYSAAQQLRSTNASIRFATFGILDFFGFTVLSGKFRLNLHSSKRVMQALYIKACDQHALLREA